MPSHTAKPTSLFLALALMASSCSTTSSQGPTSAPDWGIRFAFILLFPK